MKKKLKSKLILLFVGLASIFLLGGCALGTSLEDILDQRDLTAKVTYYANGGAFDRGQVVKQIYYQDGMNVLNVGEVSTVSGPATLERNQHDFVGWYYAELDNEGKPVYEDEEKQVVQATEEKVVFPLKITEGQSLYFVAKWEAQIRLDVYLVCDAAEIPSKDKENNPIVYENEKIIRSFPYDGGYVTSPGSGKRYRPFTPANENDFTFIEYYMDADCTVPVTFPIAMEAEQTENGKLYAKYLSGKWNVMRTESDVAELFSGTVAAKANAKYCLARDVDMSEYEYETVSPISNFACELQGNGFTIRNLKIKQEGITSEDVSKIEVSTFGKLASTAKIKDVILENVSFLLTAGQSDKNLYTYFSFTSMETGATVEMVKITVGSVITVVLGNGTKVEHYYGDKDKYATDQDYLMATQTGECYQFLVELIQD